MKRLTFLICLVIFITTSCHTPQTIPVRENLFLLDFVPYTVEGFLFTTEGYTGEYESIGMVEYKFTTSSTTQQLDDVGVIIMWIDDPFDIQSGLEIVYNEVLNLGADALINLEVIALESSPDKRSSNTLYQPSGYIIKGFAIDRL